MVRFSNFPTLDPAAYNVVHDLLAQADQQASVFAAFLFRWMAFNGWMSAVALENTDAAMVGAIVKEPRLVAAFDKLMLDDEAFSGAVTDFSSLWPVLNLKDVRAKIGYDAFQLFSRDEVLASYPGIDVKRQPADWVAGSRPSWEQLMRVIYEVRCNLFHGQKSPLNSRDDELIGFSDRLLKDYLEGSGCLEWDDTP